MSLLKDPLALRAWTCAAAPTSNITVTALCLVNARADLVPRARATLASPKSREVNASTTTLPTATRPTVAPVRHVATQIGKCMMLERFFLTFAFVPSNQPACCDLPDATCCGYDKTCCPAGNVCDPVAGSCVVPQNGTSCQTCLAAAKFLEGKGCDEGCDVLPPPGDVICELLVALGFCEWALSPNAPLLACSFIGKCYSGTCDCGYCTRYVYGRCLSFPNHCPASREPDHLSSSFLLPTLSAYHPDVCWDGRCQPGNEGCCLTCL